MLGQIVFDLDLIQRYDVAGPRYTSYPTALQMQPGFGEADYRAAVARSNRLQRPISLYFHIPFCSNVCYYCACNRIVTGDQNRAVPYLADLHHEIELQGDLLGHRPVHQLHWGGGTPTFISMAQMTGLMRKIGAHFRLLNDDSGDYSIEIDPRSVTVGTMAGLRTLGFNRVSLGVQDVDPRVQLAINRVQPIEQTATIMRAARQQGFHSINVDLIYGLPLQTVASFDETLTRVIDLAPDRLSVFNYAHMPHLFKVQKQINANDLPVSEAKLEILRHTVERLCAAGYVYIGMDHFARPDDELAIAQRTNTLQRNFQGYTTHGDCDLIGMGITSISKIDDCYCQNEKTTQVYGNALAQERLPIARGFRLNVDDLVRRAVIMALICERRVEFKAIQAEFGIDFSRYFAGEINALGMMARDGLVRLDARAIEILPPGALLLRNICMVFDAYLDQQQGQRFSRAI